MTYFAILLFTVALFFSALMIDLAAKEEWCIGKALMIGMGVTGIAITSVSIYFLAKSLI